MAEIIQLHDEEADVDVLPITHKDAIFDDDGNKVIEQLETKLETLNTNLTGIKVYVGEDGNLHFKDGTGADSVIPFLIGAKVGNVYTSGPFTNSLTIPANTETTYIVAIYTADSSNYNSMAISMASNANYTQVSKVQYSRDRSALIIYKLIKSNKSQQSVISINTNINFIVTIAID